MDFVNLKIMSAAEQIIDNVQVVVRNVHIQYVDKKTDPEVFFRVTYLGINVQASTHSVRFSEGVSMMGNLGF